MTLTSKCPLRRTKVLEQSTMRQMTTCRTTPVTDAVPFTQPIPGLVVSRYSHTLNSLRSDSCTETHKHRKHPSHFTIESYKYMPEINSGGHKILTKSIFRETCHSAAGLKCNIKI